MAITETRSWFLANQDVPIGSTRKSEGHNTDQLPGDGHEVLDVYRSRLFALACRPWLRARRWHCSDDAAVLGALRFVRRSP
jgi:hypothetical protein